jgi:iron complex outermembrane receptor protein
MRPVTHRRHALLAATALAASIALPAVALAQQAEPTPSTN